MVFFVLMSELPRYTSSETDYGSIVENRYLQSDRVTNHTKPAFFDIKRLITDGLSLAKDAGEVFWDREQVVDRPIDIIGFSGKVRYIPTFAYRQTLFTQVHSDSDSCSLCSLSKNQIQIPNQDDATDFDKFNRSFGIFANGFPYLDKQVVLSSRVHRELFTDDQYKAIFDFMQNSGFAGAGMQLRGSGASIPDHAHISVFDEALPIFNSEYRPIKDEDGTFIAKSVDHPGVCLKISGGSTGSIFYQTTSTLQKLALRGLSYNLYFDNQADAYVIPRTNLESKSMNITVGQAEVAGIFNSYVDHSETSDIEELKRQYWEIFETVTGEEIGEAIKDTTLPNDGPTFDLIY